MNPVKNTGRRSRSTSRRRPRSSQLFYPESLESRQLLDCEGIEAFPVDELFGEGGALHQLQAVIDQGTFLAEQIPLVGDQLAGSFPFGTNVRQMLTDAYENGAGSLEERLHNSLTQVLGAETIGFLDQAVEVTFDAEACVVTATVDLSRTLASWASSDLNFDVGLQSLPFYLTSDVGGIDVEVGFDMSPFSISIHGDTGQVSVDTSGTTLSVEVAAELQEGANLTAQVGFLHMQITDGLGANPEDGLRSRVEVGFDLTFGENASLLDANVSGTADLRLHMQSEVNEYLPSVSADFLLHYDLTTGEAPDVSFDNVSIELGDLASKLLGPIVNVVEPVIEPLEAVMSLISEPIPVISDLGLGEYSVLDIANGLANLGSLPPDITAYVKLANLLERITYFVGLFENADCQAADCNGTRLNFGEFSLSDLNGDLRTVDPKVFEPTLVDASLSHLSVGQFADLDGLAERLEGANLPDGLKNNLLAGLSDIQAQLNNGFTLDLPIVSNPAGIVFQWLIGQNADLFRIDASAMLASNEVDLSGPMPVGIDGGLRGGIQPSIQLGIGYDTFGLRRFLDNVRHDTDPQGADLLDGFYITGDSELSLDGFLEAYLALNALVFSVEASGGVFASLQAEVIDSSEDPTLPNVDDDDHKVRFYSEMDACSFQLSGDIHAAISFIAKLGVQLGPIFAGIQHRWDLARWDIASFDVSCIGNPLNQPESVALGTVSDDGVLTLYVGSDSNERSIEPTQANEIYSLTLVEDGATLEDGQTIRIQAFGVSQTVSGVKQIVGYFGDGDDRLTIGQGIAIPALIEGGTGDDQLRSLGMGSVQFFGNEGLDQLTGGLGDNWLFGGDDADLIIGGGQASSMTEIDGGSGDDLIFAGAGVHRVFGGLGADQITAGPHQNELHGNQGDDQFFAGQGQATIFGGTGDDQALWNVGNGIVTFDGGAGLDAMGMVGSAAVDRFVLTEQGGGVRVTVPSTDQNVWTQSDRVERLSIDGREGADQILVHSLTGTPIERLSLNLSDELDHDGAIDVIQIRSTMERDDLLVEKLDVTLSELPAHQDDARGGVMRFSGFRNHPLIVDRTYEILAMNYGDRITLNSRAGDDRITVRGVTGPTFIETDRGDDEVLVEAVVPELFGNGAGDFLSEFSIDLGRGKNRLSVSEAMALIGDTIEVTDHRISSQLLPGVHYDASRGGNLSGGVRIEAGPHDDRIHIRSTRADATTEVLGGDGDNSLLVTSQGIDGHLDFIRGKLLLDGGTGHSSISLTDRADATPNPLVTLEETMADVDPALLISGMAGRQEETPVVIVDRPQLDLILEGSRRSSIAEAFELQTTNLGLLTIRDLEGDATYNVHRTRGDLRIEGGSGNEHVLVAPQSRTLGDLHGTFTVALGSGSDQLSLYDQDTLEIMSYELTSQQLVRAFGLQTIQFDSRLETLDLFGTAVADTLNVTQFPLATTVTVDQGSGNDAIVGPASGATWVIDGANEGQLGERIRFRSSETLAAAGGTHAFEMRNGGSVTGAIIGSVAGHDTLDYSHYVGAVTIDLAVQSATGVSSFSRLDAFVGGAAIDTLRGPSQVVDWTLTGRNEGTIQPIGGMSRAFQGMERLIGGSSTDRFVIEQAGSASSIAGGGGTDELDYASFTSGVVVDLELGTATRLGQVTQIENVRGGSGDDVLRGSSASNHLQGQGGSDLLIGLAGSDLLRGGSGRDLLIGGTGADSLFGDDDSDLLIADSTTYDSQQAALLALLAEWRRADLSYGRRIAHLRNGDGLNSPHRIDGQTVLADQQVDQLFGGAESDWFWVGPGDLTLGLEAQEVVS